MKGLYVSYKIFFSSIRRISFKSCMGKSDVVDQRTRAGGSIPTDLTDGLVSKPISVNDEYRRNLTNALNTKDKDPETGFPQLNDIFQSICDSGEISLENQAKLKSCAQKMTTALDKFGLKDKIKKFKYSLSKANSIEQKKDQVSRLNAKQKKNSMKK